MAEEVTSVYNRGDTAESICIVTLHNETTDAEDLTDADSGYPKCTITDSAGTVKVDAVAMTKISTGKYIYRYDIASDAVVGWWSVKHLIHVESGGITRKETEHTGFSVS